MGIELNIDEELATICVAATETVSINNIIKAEIRKADFSQCFNSLIDELAKCLDVIHQHLSCFAALDSEDDFMEKFDGYYTAYSDCYLSVVSQPRQYSDAAYEHYLVLQSFRECKTQFPLLKRTFARLEQFVDKWVTNDAWLAMGIDNLFKKMKRLLGEVAELKQKDPTEAFLILRAAFDDFEAYLQLIANKREALRVMPVMVSSVV